MENPEEEAAAVQDEEEEDEDEEDDDDDDELTEPPPNFEKTLSQKSRQSVSAEAYGAWNQMVEFIPPIVEKPEEAKERLRAVLVHSFLFSGLDEENLAIIVDAMQERKAEAGEMIIRQGEDGDVLFIIESGSMDCIRSDGGEDRVVKTCVAGDVFGELALLYNCPRAATVVCIEEAVLWFLDRLTFNHIVKNAAQEKRQRYEGFLAGVPLLSSMDAYERSQIADALVCDTFAPGSTIVTQGDIGKTFYIVEEGAAVAIKDEVEVMRYGRGDYFGELALIRNQPRAASVVCESSVKVLILDSGSFKRLIPMQSIAEQASKYDNV